MRKKKKFVARGMKKKKKESMPLSICARWFDSQKRFFFPPLL
jgi:hypothetical protein